MKKNLWFYSFLNSNKVVSAPPSVSVVSLSQSAIELEVLSASLSGVSVRMVVKDLSAIPGGSRPMFDKLLDPDMGQTNLADLRLWLGVFPIDGTVFLEHGSKWVDGEQIELQPVFSVKDRLEIRLFSKVRRRGG
jgi:hypothetical protein